ncbi:hypothetical protein ZIOFF_050183 [Zingiber officinale]|uniref:Uncharacterized protein n=1 Tax=Zingiber officinale TaxID=94328 RepID=A0A8J5KGA3_ZINOF|nr:hypothetical protein ZIOFF_050183 [Zingiber officinale]
MPRVSFGSRDSKKLALSVESQSSVLGPSSRILLIRTGQCFLLNGFIFLGSLFILKSVVIPTLLWILPDQYEQFNAEHLYDHKAVMPFYALLRSILIELVYIFWFYPLYIFSFVLSTLWYNDIAKHAFEVLKSKESTTQAYGKNELTESQSISTTEIPGGFEGYKWNYSNVALNRRLDFFESNWPFFAGFGSPCVIPIFFFSPLVSYGVMAILYPLDVNSAITTRAKQDELTG